MKSKWTWSVLLDWSLQCRLVTKMSVAQIPVLIFLQESCVFFMHKPASSFSSTAGLCWAICIDLVNERPLAGSKAQIPWALKQIGTRQLRQAVAVPCYVQLYVYNIDLYVCTSIWSENIQYLQPPYFKVFWVIFFFFISNVFKTRKLRVLQTKYMLAYACIKM